MISKNIISRISQYLIQVDNILNNAYISKQTCKDLIDELNVKIESIEDPNIQNSLRSLLDNYSGETRINKNIEFIKNLKTEIKELQRIIIELLYNANSKNLNEKINQKLISISSSINKYNIISNLINKESITTKEKCDRILNNIYVFGTFDSSNKFVKHKTADFESYTYYYEDENNVPLDNFTAFYYDDLVSFNKHNIAPYMAAKIGIYDNEQKRIGEIDLGHLKQTFGNRVYRIGLMSDIHYNDTSVDIDPYTIMNVDGSEYDTDLENALSYYQNKEEVIMMCGAGDVSTDSKEHLRNFALNLKTKAPTTPFYSCLGNHDFQATHYEVTDLHDDKEFGLTDELLTRIGIWNEHITPKDSTIHFFNETTEQGHLSYYFEREIPNTNKSDIYVMLSVDYGTTHDTAINNGYDCRAAQKMLNYTDPNVIDIMNYLGQESRTYSQKQYDYQFYNNEELVWLKNIIDNNRNKRIFVFTHLFLPQKAGTNNSGQHYNYIEESFRISDKSTRQVAYCLCGLQFEFLNKINNEYKNVIWFGGHSHYRWLWQKFDYKINICDEDNKIVDPGDDDFFKAYRYLTGKVPENIYPAPYEYYTTANNKTGMLLNAYTNNINIQNGRYKVKIIATASYTPGRDIADPCEENAKDVTYVRINDFKQYLNADWATGYSYEEYVNHMIDCEIDVTENKVNIEICNDKPGVNFVTLNIIELYNIETNVSVVDEFIYKDKRGNRPGQTGSEHIKTYDKLDKSINTYLCDSGYTVHLPSLCRPLAIIDSYGVSLKSSEGAIMDIYEDHIDIRGIVFKDEYYDGGNEYINKYYPLAQYRLNVAVG